MKNLLCMGFHGYHRPKRRARVKKNKRTTSSYPPPMDLLCNAPSLNDGFLEYLHEYDEYSDSSLSLSLSLSPLLHTVSTSIKKKLSWKIIHTFTHFYYLYTHTHNITHTHTPQNKIDMIMLYIYIYIKWPNIIYKIIFFYK